MNQKPQSPRFIADPNIDRPPVEASNASENETEVSAVGAMPMPIDDALSLDDAMRCDRFRLPRLRKRISREKFQRQLAQSIAQRATRNAATPRIDYPPDLPITSHRDDLLRLIRERQVTIVCGETGSGKSTQLPKLLLEAGLGREAMIGHTQPRRLAARSIATRLAEEIGTPLGKWVGYQVRFGDQTGPETLVKLMTDGILLAETTSDRFLDRYDAIIIDEAHERSLNIDFLLGYLRRLQEKRPDLKIIITSATIDAERFAEHFSDVQGPAPIVNVEGRGYPVETRYLPWDEVVDDPARGYDLARHVIAGIELVTHDGLGDMLVFLPTERDIREVSHRVGGHLKRIGMTDRIDLLPLYARLPQKEQQRIFQPTAGRRRFIFATNVAESSLTVPGIRYVVDSGTARISRYSPRSKVQRLPIEAVSRASANQRSGRCGRVGPGTCVRLYSEEDFESRDAFTTPEIRRTNLASVILQTKVLQLGRLEEFPLLDPPREEAIRDGIRTLIELGAIDDRHELTDVGYRLGRLPVDPRVGRILLAAMENQVLPEVLPIAAALEIADPRDRPPDKQQAADEAHRQFVDARSDFLSYLRLWRFYGQARSEYSRSQLTRVLRKSFLSPSRMREWADVYRQLREMTATSLHDRQSGRQKIGEIRWIDDEEKLVDDDRYAQIHQSLLSGLLSGIAMAGDEHQYTGGGGLKLFLWPGSGVFKQRPKWIVAAEFVETAKPYARTVAQIQPQWLERIGAHLIKRSHSDPHWSQKGGGAFCYERQSLFGLPVVARRRVPLPPIDPATARDLLIDQGLAERQLATNAKFVRHNRQLRDSIASLAAKSRRRDLVVDSHVIARFYQSRLPADVSDRGRMEKFDRGLTIPEWAKRLRTAADVSQWLQSPPPTDPADQSTLYMRPEDLIETASDMITQEDFPDELEVGKSKLPLEYRFVPGGERDGINVRVHKAALSQLSDERLGWLVPGLLRTKIIAMIKSLPKRIRRNLVPAAEVADKIVVELQQDYGRVPFLPAVCEAMTRQADMPVTAADFQSDKLDDYLRFLVTVVDDEGQVVAEGRQIEPLREAAGISPTDTTNSSVGEMTEDWSRESMHDFEIDELPSEVVRNRGGVQVAQYPGLIDLGDGVATRLFADEAASEASTRIATMRLFVIAERKELRRQVRWLPEFEACKVKLSGAVSAREIEASLIDLLARVAFVEGEPLVRTRTAFQSRRNETGVRIAEATQAIAAWLPSFAEAYFSARQAIESITNARYDSVRQDIDQQLRWLLPVGFLSVTPWIWLKHYPRYFQAVAYRLEKVRTGAASRDAESKQTVGNLWNRWLESLPESNRDPITQTNSEFRWMIEELRVSLFAQPLGTSVKVSPQRCEKLLGTV